MEPLSPDILNYWSSGDIRSMSQLADDIRALSAEIKHDQAAGESRAAELLNAALRMVPLAEKAADILEGRDFEKGAEAPIPKEAKKRRLF